MPTAFHTRYHAKRQTLLTERAKAMRDGATESERRLWQCLVNRKLGVPFRRQYVIGERIVDFVARSVRLVVEVDGGSHAGRAQADARRDRELERAGYRVLHVEAGSVMRELGAVVEAIRGAVARG